MNKKMIFTVTCDQFNLGTNFLIWSINYVTGQKNFYLAKDNKTIDIPDSPLLNGITAHKIFPNHACNIDEYNERLRLIESNSLDEKFNHIKYTPNAPTIEKYHSDKNAFHKYVNGLKYKTINVTCDRLEHLIGFLRFNHENADWQNDIDTLKKHCKHYWPDFFQHPEIFKNNLQTFHDLREGIAFNIRPYDFWKGHQIEELDLVRHYKFKDLLFKGQDQLLKILEFLDLEYNKGKLQKWLLVHETWKNNLGHYIIFANDIELILENILHNQSMDLTKYKMDVCKEAVLLHLLMFKHGLNIGVSIESLPKNTKDILPLLTANERSGIQKIYG